MTIKGSCLCGAVTYQVRGRLRDARSCHCSQCRKAFSSQASAYALVEAGEFSWTSGEALLSSHESGNGAGLKFCSRCGSTLCGTLNGEVNGVTLGCVEGDPGVTLERHIFTGSKAAWETIPEDILHYEAWPPEDG